MSVCFIFTPAASLYCSVRRVPSTPQLFSLQSNEQCSPCDSCGLTDFERQLAKNFGVKNSIN